MSGMLGIKTLLVSILAATTTGMTCSAKELRFGTTPGGRIRAFEVNKGDGWESVPFRSDETGTSWYVRDADGVKTTVVMKKRANLPKAWKLPSLRRVRRTPRSISPPRHLRHRSRKASRTGSVVITAIRVRAIPPPAATPSS